MRPQDAAEGDPALRRGITLLEVLIACGLLVVGLSTVASILPAAGSRLAQATLEDRAVVIASNAHAEVTNRELAAVECFPAGVGGNASPGRTLAIGAVLGQLPTFGELSAGRSANAFFSELSAEGRRRGGSPRTFLLEDEITFEPSSLAPTPANVFAADGLGLGPRQTRQRMCWGATLTPKVFPPKAGSMAVLTIAVFKKAGDGLPLTLTRTNSFYEVDPAPTGQLLRACTWLLALGRDATTPPRWFQVMSSWTPTTSDSSKVHLVLKDQEGFAEVTGATASGSTATVIAFEGLVRVDECLVTLL
jgi:hypothetical protein